MSIFEQEQLRERLKDKEPISNDKWFIDELKAQAKIYKKDPEKRDKYLKVKSKIDRNNEYKLTKEYTADDFDNLGTSYVDYITSPATTNALIVKAHIINFYRRNGKDSKYYFSYETIADDLNSYGCSISAATVRTEIRRLRSIGLLYAIKYNKNDTNGLKGSNQHRYRSIHINYHKLNELTSAACLDPIKIKSMKNAIEKKIATKPFVICKYNLPDKDRYLEFAWKLHKELNKHSKKKNEYIKYKPSHLLTEQEKAIIKLKQENKGFKKKIKAYTST